MRVALKLLFLVCALTMFFTMPAYAQQVTVPNVVGLPADQAIKTVQNLGLKAPVTVEGMTPDQKQAGKITKQNPAAGQKVATGAAVALFTVMYQAAPTKVTVAPSVPATAQASQIVVPNVVGMPGLDANKALQKTGLKPQYSMDATPTPDKAKADKIVKQEPASGRSVPSGSVVTLYVYMYQPPAPPKPQPVKIPDVVGKKNTDAYKLLESAGLRHVDGFGLTSTTDKSKLHTIASQNPPAGQSVNPGSVVTVVVYNVVSAPIVTAKMPNLYRMDATQAKQALAALGFKNYTEVVVATKVMGDQGKVLGQQPSAGTAVSVTQPVALHIGYYRR